MSPDAIRFLAEKGLSALEIAEFAELVALAPASDRTNAERQARYRARMDVSPIEWAVLRAAVFKRDNYACTYCGSQIDLHCDHVVPLIQGGASTMGNLTTACRPCNSGKSGRSVEEWRA